MRDKTQEPSKSRTQPPTPRVPDVATTEATVAAVGPERIAKVMARAGLCSRRDAEVWIKDGRVAVNGVVLTSPALNVGPDDRIAVDGQPVTARERTRLFLYHKPRGLVTTARDPEGRQTVFDALPPGLPRVVSVGRLDINTEGLLLLTNDGGLARVLELPTTGWLRRYRVRANGFVTPEKLDALRDGITVDGIDYAGIEATLDRTQGANQWITMGLREGKNREIKRVLEHLGLAVNRLIRVSFGPFQLGDLAEGTVEEVRPRVLKDQLGDALAAEAGVIWEDVVQAAVVTRAEAERSSSRGTAGTGTTRSGSSRPARSATGDRAAARPRQDKPTPRARPHVSALRGDAAAPSEGPRKRITRRTTEDRAGRLVAVERLTTDTRERHRGSEGGTSRNARNFARERRDAQASEATPPRTSGPGRSRPAQSERSGGFSSERPMTGRALKDGKVRRSPDLAAAGKDARPRKTRPKDARPKDARPTGSPRGKPGAPSDRSPPRGRG